MLRPADDPRGWLPYKSATRTSLSSSGGIKRSQGPAYTIDFYVDTLDRKALACALIYLDNEKGKGKGRYSV